MSIPSTYLDAEDNPPPKLGLEGLTILRHAQLLADSPLVTEAMARALSSSKRVVNARWGWQVPWDTPSGTVNAMAARGLTCPRGRAGRLSRDLTPLGIQALEAVSRTPKDPS